MKDPVETYLSSLPPLRSSRLREIATAITEVFPDAERSMKYRMPTFETAAGFISIGNQKHHISVYTCSAEMISDYVGKHPATDHGKGCLRFRDSAAIDMTALRKVIRRALS